MLFLTQPGGNAISSIIMIVLMIAVFYFLMIRPENKKKKQMDEMRRNVKIGDNITTIGGLVGDVCHVDEKNDTIVIEVGADRVRIELYKWGISTNNSAQKEAEKARMAAKKTKEPKEKKAKEPKENKTK